MSGPNPGGIAFGAPDPHQNQSFAAPDAVVPQVPGYGGGSAWGAPAAPQGQSAWGQGGGAWGAPPAPGAPSTAGTVPAVMPVVSPLGQQQPALSFTQSTATPSVSGNIGAPSGQNAGRSGGQAGARELLGAAEHSDRSVIDLDLFLSCHQARRSLQMRGTTSLFWGENHRRTPASTHSTT